jgi:hypothetical protein
MSWNAKITKDFRYFRKNWIRNFSKDFSFVRLLNIFLHLLIFENFDYFFNIIPTRFLPVPISAWHGVYRTQSEYSAFSTGIGLARIVLIIYMPGRLYKDLVRQIGWGADRYKQNVRERQWHAKTWWVKRMSSKGRVRQRNESSRCRLKHTPFQAEARERQIE